MAQKQSKKRRSRKTVPVLQSIGTVAGFANLAIPYIGGKTVAAAKNGDLTGVVVGIRDDSKVALSGQRILAAAAPPVIAAAMGKGLRMTGIKNPKIGRFRMF